MRVEVGGGAQFIEGCSAWEIKDQIMRRTGEFHKCIFQ